MNELYRVLTTIQNPKLRAYVLSKLDKAPAYFKTVPASRSGKYHPPSTRGEGGLVKHTVATAKMVKLLGSCDYFGIDRHELDYMIAAAVLHDIFKYGKEEEAGDYNENHAADAADVCSDWSNPKLGSYIRSHMASFGNNRPGTLPAALVGLADFIASREDVEVKTEVQ